MKWIILAILIVALAVFIRKYVWYDGSKKECDEEFRVLLKEVSDSSALDSSKMQLKISQFHIKHRRFVSHDFLFTRVNKLYSKVKYPSINEYTRKTRSA